MGILGDRLQVSKTSPMPVNDITTSTDIVQVTGESVSIAGGAAGTGVSVVLDKAPIYNSNGVRVGLKEDSSFSFVTGTCLTTEIDPSNAVGTGTKFGGNKAAGLYDLLDKMEAAHLTAAQKVTEVTSGFSNGQFVLDYENGIAYGLKATAATSDTATYKTRAFQVVVTDSGGAITTLPYFDADGDNTAQALKASAGALYQLNVYNSNAADAFIQLFDTAAGSVTVGATVPIYVSLVPAGGGVILDFNSQPFDFGTAITYACTTAPTTNGDPAVGLTVSGVYA